MSGREWYVAWNVELDREERFQAVGGGGGVDANGGKMESVNCIPR